MAGGKSVLRVHDTRGVLCVHGVPGFLAAISGIIATAIASLSPLVFGTPFATLFPPVQTECSLSGYRTPDDVQEVCV